MFEFRFMLPRFDVDGSGGGGSTESAAPASTEAPAATTAPTNEPAITFVNPLRSGLTIEQQREAAKPAPVVAPTVEPVVTPTPVVEEIDFGGRKVKVIDPVIKDLHQDYSHLNTAYTQSQQRVRDLESSIQAAQKQTAVVEVPVQQPTAPVAPDPARMQEINEKFAEMHFDNPMGALVWLNQQPEYQQLMQPIQQQHVEKFMTESQQKEQTRTQNVEQAKVKLVAAYPDFNDMLPAISDVVNRFPHIAQQIVDNPSYETLESAYLMAKGMGGAPAPVTAPPVEPVQPASQPAATTAAPVTAETLLADPAFIAQLASNPQLQQTIITNYINSVNNNQSQLPVIIGNGPGGQSPTAPENKPKSIKEAGQLFRRWYNGKSG